MKIKKRLIEVFCVLVIIWVGMAFAIPYFAQGQVWSGSYSRSEVEQLKELEKAEALVKEEHWEEAQESYEKALALEDGQRKATMKIYASRARSYSLYHEFELAAEDYKHLLSEFERLNWYALDRETILYEAHEVHWRVGGVELGQLIVKQVEEIKKSQPLDEELFKPIGLSTSDQVYLLAANNFRARGDSLKAAEASSMLTYL